MGILAFIVIGFIAGLLARAVMPGNQPMGLLATTLLGMVGSLVGGLIGSLFHSNGNFMDVRPSGIIMSVLGSLLVLALAGLATRGRRRVSV